MRRCPNCGSDDIDLVERLRAPAMILRCESCGTTWQHGEEPEVVEPGQTRDQRLRGRFPTADDISNAVWAMLRESATSTAYGKTREGDKAFKERYHVLFAKERISHLTVDDFVTFYTTPAYADIGPAVMAIRTQMAEYGEDDYTAGVREAIEYLLYSEKGSLEQRFTDLVEGKRSPALPGLKESILTKVLCAADPDRFFPLLVYDSPDGSGKRQIAEAVLGLALPPRDRSDWTIGRLAIWSNDLFVEIAHLLDISDLQRAGEMIWWLWVQARDTRES